MKFKKRAKKHAKIEVIPLIDVVFFLLATFVMVSLSMTKNEGITVNVPSASTSSPKENKEAICAVLFVKAINELMAMLDNVCVARKHFFFSVS